MIREIIVPSHVSLPPELMLSREPPRPLDARQPDYEAQFDYSTLIYDVFKFNRSVVAVGPPLLNLKPFARQFGYYRSGINYRPKVKDMNRMSRWMFERSSRQKLQKWLVHLQPLLPTSASRLCGRVVPTLTPRLQSWKKKDQLIVSFGQGVMSPVQIGRNLCYIFSNARCLLTKSKNNDLQWIHDWVAHHVRYHGANAVLLYDNNSDRYEPNDILDAVSSISQLEIAVIVCWPFKWGPHGDESGIWDSDFSQHGILEHARWRLLQSAKSVVYQDIDELAFSPRSIFEIAETAPHGAIVYDGRWIENVVENANLLKERTPRHSDFKFFDPSAPPASRKWCTVPRENPRSEQWRVHWVKPATVCSEVQLKHFRGITTGWKHDRPRQEYDSSKHEIDKDVAALIYDKGTGSGVNADGADTSS